MFHYSIALFLLQYQPAQPSCVHVEKQIVGDFRFEYVHSPSIRQLESFLHTNVATWKQLCDVPHTLRSKQLFLKCNGNRFKAAKTPWRNRNLSIESVNLSPISPRSTTENFPLPLHIGPAFFRQQTPHRRTTVAAGLNIFAKRAHEYWTSDWAKRVPGKDCPFGRPVIRGKVMAAPAARNGW